MEIEECNVTIEIECAGLPSVADVSLALGIQREDEITELKSTEAKKIVFNPALRARRNPDESVNFLGPFAHGPKSERFIYLNWVTTDGAAHASQLGRIKLHLNHITWPQVKRFADEHKPLKVKLELTNAKGKPVMASVRGDVAKWVLV